MNDQIVEHARAALLQARREGLTLRMLAQRCTTLGLSTLKAFIAGTYRGNNVKVAERVLTEVTPLLKRWPPKPSKPPQLRELSRSLHRLMRAQAQRAGAKHIATVTGIDHARVWPLINGTDKQGAADVLDTLSSRLQEVA